MKRVPPIVLGGLMALYLALGVYTELKFMELKPPPQGLHEDFGYYTKALADTAAGKGPYAEQSIGRGFLYPPTALFVVEPFARIASRMARIVVFTVVSVAMACLAVWLVARSFGLSPAETWWWYALALGSAPFLEVLHMGQINTFTALGTALLFAGTSMAPWVSGVGLALGTLTKVTPLVLVLYLVVARRYEALSAGGWIIAVALGLAGLRYGWGSLAQYPGVFSWLTTQFSLDANPPGARADGAHHLRGRGARRERGARLAEQGGGAAVRGVGARDGPVAQHRLVPPLGVPVGAAHGLDGLEEAVAARGSVVHSRTHHGAGRQMAADARALDPRVRARVDPVGGRGAGAGVGSAGEGY